METFADRLTRRIRECGNPVCVGLDPRLDQLPVSLTSGVNPSSLASVANAYQRFCVEIIEVVCELVPIVKPQMAFFEQLGPAGMQALHDVVSVASQRGLLVLLDGKRNDIGSTATAYADAYLGRDNQSPWGADALTVSPYLGADSLDPFVSTAVDRRAGIFVLVKTSNPGSGHLQDLVAENEKVYRHVGRWLEQANREHLGQSGYGPVGAVAGATHPEQLSEIRSSCPHSILLVPGYGAQGGGANEVAAAFDSAGNGAIINSSRGIIFAHRAERFRERFGEQRWQQAVEAATLDMIAALKDVM